MLPSVDYSNATSNKAAEVVVAVFFFFFVTVGLPALGHRFRVLNVQSSHFGRCGVHRTYAEKHIRINVTVQS